MKKIGFVVVLLIPVHLILACCMVPRTYKGTIHQNTQEAVIFHDRGMQDMILRINYEIDGEGAPDRFAWIITVPNEPERYAVADAKVYEEVFAWADPLVQPPRPRGLFKNLAEDAAVDDQRDLAFSEPVKVGPYDIQPVKVKGAEALGELNAWLSKNDFPTEDPKHMKYFAENGFTFLCIKINPAKGQAAVGTDGDLEPLHLSFKSEDVYYPLRFSSRQGVFDVNLTVLTREKLDYRKSAANLNKIGWSARDLKKNVVVSRDDFPEALAAAYAHSSFNKLAEKHWHLNVIRTRHTNRGNTIAKWDADVFFQTGGKPAKAAKRFLLF